MTSEYYESKSATGEILRWFVIDIDAENIEIVRELLDMLEQKTVAAMLNGNYKKAISLAETALGIGDALNKWASMETKKGGEDGEC